MNLDRPPKLLGRRSLKLMRLEDQTLFSGMVTCSGAMFKWLASLLISLTAFPGFDPFPGCPCQIHEAFGGTKGLDWTLVERGMVGVWAWNAS